MRLDVPVEQRADRLDPLLTEEAEVGQVTEQVGRTLVEAPAEDHRAGAGADVHLLAQQPREHLGQSGPGDALREMELVAAGDPPDIGPAQTPLQHARRQTVEVEHVELAPAHAVQVGERLDEPAVVAGLAQRGGHDRGDPGLGAGLAQQLRKRLTQSVVGQSVRSQQHPHGSDCVARRPSTAWPVRRRVRRRPRTALPSGERRLRRRPSRPRRREARSVCRTFRSGQTGHSRRPLTCGSAPPAGLEPAALRLVWSLDPCRTSGGRNGL